MTNISLPQSQSLVRTGLGLWFIILWLVLMPSVKPVDLAIGLLATMAATSLSLHLLPRTAGRVRFARLTTRRDYLRASSYEQSSTLWRRQTNGSSEFKQGHSKKPAFVANVAYARSRRCRHGSRQ
jgi:hypothetical protein